MILNYTRAWIGGGLALLSVSLFWACKTEEKLPKLGESIAGPVDVVSSPTGNYFYVLNSDYERKFNQGSILVIDPETTPPAKVASIAVPRMGRSLNIGQNFLLVTYDAVAEGELRRVELWDLKDERSPVLAGEWSIGCSPINGIIAPTQPYFAVGCTTGEVYMGSLNRSNVAASTLDLVRGYGYAHRALYFYEGASTWLMGFPTDVDTPDVEDFAATDVKTYELTSDSMKDGADEVPDSLQDTLQARRRPNAGYPYQMFLYNVTTEEAASKADPEIGTATFRYVATGTFAKPSLVNSEMRYIYFTVRDIDGTPSSTEGTVELNNRFYRTNFWMAQSTVGGTGEVFFLSQRGNSYGSPSNNVLKLQINPTALANATSTKFSEIFKVERVYGFANDRDSTGRYPGAFAVTELDGEPMLLINHFRDLINFRNAPFYGITRKFLNAPFSQEQASSFDSTTFDASFYQLAVASSGKVLTCSFYGNALFLFDARPRNSMRDQTPIRIE